VSISSVVGCLLLSLLLFGSFSKFSLKLISHNQSNCSAPPTIKPVTLGINELSRLDPDATSTAKLLFGSSITEIVNSLRASARTLQMCLLQLAYEEADHYFTLNLKQFSVSFLLNFFFNTIV